MQFGLRLTHDHVKFQITYMLNIAIRVFVFIIHVYQMSLNLKSGEEPNIHFPWQYNNRTMGANRKNTLANGWTRAMAG